MTTRTIAILGSKCSNFFKMVIEDKKTKLLIHYDVEQTTEEVTPTQEILYSQLFSFYHDFKVGDLLRFVGKDGVVATRVVKVEKPDKYFVNPDGGRVYRYFVDRPLPEEFNYAVDIRWIGVGVYNIYF